MDCVQGHILVGVHLEFSRIVGRSKLREIVDPDLVVNKHDINMDSFSSCKQFSHMEVLRSSKQPSYDLLVVNMGLAFCKVKPTVNGQWLYPYCRSIKLCLKHAEHRLIEYPDQGFVLSAVQRRCIDCFPDHQKHWRVELPAV